MRPPSPEHIQKQQEQPFEYRIMIPDTNRTKAPTPEALQEKYIWMLSDLVRDAVEDPETRCDTIVFLDKSARPLEWMMSTFWEEIAPQERDPQTGELRTVPMPERKFVNIDRLYWRADPNKEIEEGGARAITPEDLNGLRSIFQIGDKNVLDGKRILIVDEQSESGDTLDTAVKLFEMAYPGSQIRGKAFIRHPVSLDQDSGEYKYAIEEIPPWYPLKGENKLPEDETGRGVYSPIPYARRSEAYRRRHPESSTQFSSTRPRIAKQLSDWEKSYLQGQLEAADDPTEKARIAAIIDQLSYTTVDQKSMMLRREIVRMMVDFMTGKLNPSIATDREEIRGEPARQYRSKVGAQKTKPKSLISRASR